jgi:hypothetical protein
MKRLFAVQHTGTGRKIDHFDFGWLSCMDDSGDILYFENKQDAKVVRDWATSDKSGQWVVVPGPDHHRYEK